MATERAGVNPFRPHSLLRNPHTQTLVSALWPRRFPRLPSAAIRDFETEPGTRIRGACHWQSDPQAHPTVVLVHGLEGSCESGYMRGLAEKAFALGWNAIRLNQRNCGGTELLTPTLYNSGLSADYRAVLLELVQRDALPEVFFAGYSMGGNLTLKMAGELGSAAPAQLRAIAAVCPCIDLATCADAVGLRQNFVYQWHFVRNLKRRMRRKALRFPGQFDVSFLERVRTLREFDDAITARYFGFRDAADYYERSSALRVMDRIRVPALLITAQDDPFVPFGSFGHPAVAGNPHVQVLAPDHGGHCAFISNAKGSARFWAEARILEFFKAVRSEDRLSARTS